MKFFQAFFKLAARKANDKLTLLEVRNAQGKAYNETGKQISKANKKGKYINGRNAYKINYQRAKGKAIKNGRAREQFINDL